MCWSCLQSLTLPGCLASELFSQQTCKWIPNGLFTYITLPRAPLQGRAPQTYQMSINLGCSQTVGVMTQFREHFTSAGVLHQPGVEQGRQRPERSWWQPPLPGNIMAEHWAKTGTSEETGKKDYKNTGVIPPLPIAMVTKERLCRPWC